MVRTNLVVAMAISSVAATEAKTSLVAAMVVVTVVRISLAVATVAMAAAKVRVVVTTRFDGMKLIEIENLDVQIFFN